MSFQAIWRWKNGRHFWEIPLSSMIYVTGNKNSLIALVRATSGKMRAAGTGRKYHQASIAAP
jgi:hypothetical protein